MIQLSNIYTKNILRIVASVVAVFGLVSFINPFTGWLSLSDVQSIILGGVAFAIFGYLVSRKFFVRYNREEELVEIEQSRLFSSTRMRKLGQKNFPKNWIQSYEVIDRWYGKKLVINSTKWDGTLAKNEFPILFLSNKKANAIRVDLTQIMNADDNLFIGSNFRNPYIG